MLTAIRLKSALTVSVAISIATCTGITCAVREPLEPHGNADVRLIGRPGVYSSPDGLVWVGAVRNYGFKRADRVRVLLTFRGGVEGFSGLDTYDGALRPYEEADYEVYRNERTIDKIRITWQEPGDTGSTICRSYLYEYIGELLFQNGQTPCD